METCGKVKSRPTWSAKDKFKRNLTRLTSRKRPGTFEDIVKEINQYSQGWINYYKESSLKSFLKEQMARLRRRLRQLIWKRWKKVKTKYLQLKGRGATHDEAMAYANSRKSYWRMSKTMMLHTIFTKDKFEQWQLKDFVEILEK